MKQWIGLIIVLGCAYWVWTQYGGEILEKHPPATPEVAWYLDEIEHHFAIVPERGGAWFLRGFHENKTTSSLSSVTAKVFVREGDGWSPIGTFQLGRLEPEQREVFDLPIKVPRSAADDPKLRWEIVSVRMR